MRRCVASAEQATLFLHPPHPVHRLEYTYQSGWLPDASKHWLQ
jgi:hypothetical protein